MVELPAHPRRTVVIQTGLPEEVVFTSPLVRALRRRFPATRLGMVVAPRGEGLARHLPGVDEVQVFAGQSFAEAWSFGRSLAAELVLVADPSKHAALMAFGIRGAVRVGTRAFPQRLALDLPVAMNQAEFVNRMLALARALGADATQDLHLRLSDAELAQGRALLGPGSFASAILDAEHDAQRLPASRWAEILDGLLERGITPVLLGSPQEIEFACSVCSASRKREGYLDFAGRDVHESLALLSATRLAIGGDSRLLHAARALGVRVVAIFGPTDPRLHVWESASEVVRLGLPCQPCLAPVCPLGHGDCLQKLPVKSVLAAAEDRLK